MLKKWIAGVVGLFLLTVTACSSDPVSSPSATGDPTPEPKVLINAEGIEIVAHIVQNVTRDPETGFITVPALEYPTINFTITNTGNSTIVLAATNWYLGDTPISSGHGDGDVDCEVMVGETIECAATWYESEPFAESLAAAYDDEAGATVQVNLSAHNVNDEDVLGGQPVSFTLRIVDDQFYIA